MSYEFQVNAGVSGFDQVKALGTETDKQIDRTKNLTDALQAYLLKNDKYIQSAKSYAEQQARIAQLTEQYGEIQRKRFEAEESGWRRLQGAQDAAIKQNQKYADDAAKAAEKIRKAQEDAAKAAQRANEELGASVKNWIQNPLGAAGEAAEDFVLKYGKIGVAALGVSTGLAVVGGWLVSNAGNTAKYAQEISNLASRTGLTTTETQLYSRASEVAGVNAGTLTAAMRTLSKSLSDNSEEGKKQKQVLAELGLGMDAAYRPMGELLPDIFEKLSKVDSAMERDRMTIALLGRSGLELEPLFAHFKELEARVSATGIVMSEKGTAEAAKYQEQLVLLGQQWDALKLTLGQDAIGVIRFITGGKDVHLQDTEAGPWWLGGMTAGQTLANGVIPGVGSLAALNAQRMQNQDTQDFDQAVMRGPKAPGALAPADLQMQSNQQALEAYNAARASKLGREAVLQEELRKLGEERGPAEQAFSTAGDSAARTKAAANLADIDKRIEARKQELEVIHKSAGELQRMAELDKRSREAYAKSLQDGEPSAQRKYNDALITAFANNRSEQANVTTPAHHRQVDADSQLEMSAAFNNYLRDRAKEFEKAVEDLGAHIEEAVKRSDEAQSKAEKLIEKNSAELVKATSWLKDPPVIAAPAGYVSPEGQLREANTQNARDLRNESARQRIAGIDDPNATYQVRIANADREYAAEMRIAELKDTDAKKSEAALDALDKKKEAYYQAEIDRQEALAAAVQEQAKSFASGITSLLAAGRAKGGIGVQNYFKDYAFSQGEKVLGNVAEYAWTGGKDDGTGGIGGVANKFRATDPNSLIGKFAKGTPFGADPAVTETKNNTDATADNTAQIKINNDALNKLLQTIPGSPTYNPTAQANAVAEYQSATGSGGGAAASMAGGASAAPGLNTYMAPGLINTTITDDSSGAGSAITGDASAISAAISRVSLGKGTASDMAMLKSVSSGMGGIGKLITAFSSSGGSDSSSSAPVSTGLPYTVVGPPVLTDDPEAGMVQMGGGATPGAYTVIGPPALTNDPEAGMVQTGYTPTYDDASYLAASAPASGPSTGSRIAGAAGAGLAAFGIYSGLKAGGAQGDLTALGSAAGGVAAVMTMLGSVSSAIPILGAVAPVLGMVASLIGNPKENREKAIQKDLKYSQFMAPVALNETMSTNGTYLDSNQQGGVRTSDLSPNEIVQQGFYDYKHNTTAPGQVLSTFSYANAPGGTQTSAAAAAATTNINITAMDSQDVQRVLSKHVGVLGDVLNKGLQTGATGTGLQDTISRL